MNFKEMSNLIGPHQLSLDITNNCNFRCLHCFNLSGENSIAKDELSDDEILHFVESLLPLHLRAFCFCGGEPLLKLPVLLESTRLLANSGVNVALVSNGYLITEKAVMDLVMAGLRRIQFSLDGFSSSTHDRLRQKNGSFERVLKSIAIVKNYCLSLSLAFTPTLFNICEFDKLYEYLCEQQYYIDGKPQIELRCQPLMILGRSFINKNQLLPTEKQYRHLVSRVDFYNDRRYPVHIEWGDPVDHIIRFSKYNLKMQVVAVRANGDLIISPYFPLVVGNIRKYSLREYWDAGLSDIWGTKVALFFSGLIHSIADMGEVTAKLPRAYYDDINIDLIEDGLDALDKIGLTEEKS